MTSKAAYDANMKYWRGEVITVSCPACKADPGQRCTFARQERINPHEERIVNWRRKTQTWRDSE